MSNPIPQVGQVGLKVCPPVAEVAQTPPGIPSEANAGNSDLHRWPDPVAGIQAARNLRFGKGEKGRAVQCSVIKLYLKMKKLLLTFIAGCAAIFFGTANLLAATVTTDQADYAPGSTAIITGAGFQAGETVELQVLRIDINENSGPEHNPWQVTADASGGFSTSWYVTQDEVGATLQLTATGLTLLKALRRK